jgi:hypothetical protein
MLPENQVLIGIPATVIWLDDSTDYFVDFLLDESVNLSRPRIDGGGRLFLLIDALQLVFSEYDHGFLLALIVAGSNNRVILASACSLPKATAEPYSPASSGYPVPVQPPIAGDHNKNHPSLQWERTIKCPRACN